LASGFRALSPTEKAEDRRDIENRGGPWAIDSVLPAANSAAVVPPTMMVMMVVAIVVNRRPRIDGIGCFAD
jgi:hypothetical protein